MIDHTLSCQFNLIIKCGTHLISRVSLQRDAKCISLHHQLQVFFLQKDALIVIQVIYYHVNPILSSNVESISSRGSCILQQPLSSAAEMKLEAVQWNWGHSGKSTTETLPVSMSYKFENSQNSILHVKCGWWGILCLQLLML